MSSAAELDPPPTPFEREVLDKTIGEIRTFLAEIANGSRHYLTIHNLTEQIEHQYHGRFVIELLQNAHDALQADPTTGSRRVEFALDPAEGPHGALYIANDGQPFRRQNLRAVANLGQSSKDPRESIGNKGIGFRSVLEVCRTPEIHSRAGEPCGRFDGYCFRFTPEILTASAAPLTRLLDGADTLVWPLGDRAVPLDDLRAEQVRARCRDDEIDLASEFRQLSPYLLPLPAPPTDDRIRDFARRGFATVVKLPLSSAEAWTITVEKLRELDSDTLVFLDALEFLTVDAGEGRRCLERRGGAASRKELSIVVRDGEAEVEYRRWGYVLQDAAALSKATAALPGKWKEMTEAHLAIAVRVRGRTAAGRYFIHLPTEVSTGTGALLHAPFFGEMSRKAIDFAEPLNRLLRDTLASCVADVIRKHLTGRGEIEARAVVDLLAPTPGGAGDPLAIQRASLRDTPLLLTDRGWQPPMNARLVPLVPDAHVLTSEQIRACAQFSAVHQALDDRRPLVESLLQAFAARQAPTDPELSATLEAVAAQHRGSWVDFWREVEALLPGRRAEVLRGRRVLVDDQGVLHPAGGAGGIQVFFPHVLDDAAVASTPIEIPESLRARIAFLSSKIPLGQRRSDGREESSNFRRYLDPLVADYRVETILRAVLASPPGTGGDIREDTLDLAVRLVRRAREIVTLIPELRRLWLPCWGGWFPPAECFFGPGWPETRGDLLERYLKEAGTVETTFIHKRLLVPPDHPSWRNHGVWLREHLPAIGVRDGLFPTEAPAEWQRWFRMQFGVPVTLPACPPGFPARAWTSWAATAAEEIEPEFSRSFPYELTGVQGLAGLDVLDRLSPEGRRALTLLLFHSIPRFPPGWKRSVCRKASGNSHVIEIGSFLHHALRTLPWIHGADDVGAPPSERWFVRATVESSQRRHYEHLRPLPPDLTRELVRLGPQALDALAALDMPVLDLDASTSDPRLLEALAEALVQNRVPSTAYNVFPGQVRDAWRVFTPDEGGRLPAAMIVQKAGRPPEVHRPTAETPIYFPDTPTRAGPGPFGGLPIALMEVRDATRLLPHYQTEMPGSVRALSSLQAQILVGGGPWTRRQPAEGLMSSQMHWVGTLALAASAFGGPQAHGTQTKEFKQRLAAVRAASIEIVSDLSMRLLGLDDSAPPWSIGAVWDANTQTILYDPGTPDGREALAEPLAELLDRVDVITRLRYALSKLPQDREPEGPDLDRAAAAIQVTSTQLSEIRQLCTGDHDWVCERLRPAVILLAPIARWEEFAIAETVEALENALAAVLPPDVTPAWLVELARESRDDRAMGMGLFEAIGERAELSAWNAALARLGPPYHPLVNTEADDQHRVHRHALQLPMRALARYLCLRDAARSFTALAEALRGCPAPPGLSAMFWTVPFEATLAALTEVLDPPSLPAAVRAALSGPTKVEELVDALAAIDPALQPTLDPTEVHRANVAACEQALAALRRAALAWCAREGVPLGGWLDSAALPAALRARLDAGAGFLVCWDEHRALAALSEFLVHESAHLAFWAAVAQSESVVALCRLLDLGDADFAKVEQAIEAAQERRRRAARTLTVCGAPFEAEAENLGRLWDHLARCVKDDSLPIVDPRKTPSLSPMSAPEGRPSGRGGGGGGRPPRPSEDHTKLVGLVGEIFAYRMLRKRFGDTVVSPGVWVSENSRHCFPQNHGDDGLGYDFQIVVGRRTWLIEVKATSGRDAAFELGPTEVRAATECVRKRTIYLVLHVQDALSSVPAATFLPNPFSEEGQEHYRIEEGGLYVRYRLATPGGG